MDIMNISFKELEKVFNEFINNNVKVLESIYPEQMRETVFNSIKQNFKDLTIVNISDKYNNFSINIEYKNNYKGIIEYDTGHIELIFTISTSKTKKNIETTKLRKKYIHELRANPVKFEGLNILPFVKTFNWSNNDDLGDLYVCEFGYNPMKYDFENKNFDNITDVINDLKSCYKDDFLKRISQPWLKSIGMQWQKYESILNTIPMNLKDRIIKNDFEFKELGMFIIDNNYFKLNED